MKKKETDTKTIKKMVKKELKEHHTKTGEIIEYIFLLLVIMCVGTMMFHISREFFINDEITIIQFELFIMGAIVFFSVAFGLIASFIKIGDLFNHMKGE